MFEAAYLQTLTCHFLFISAHLLSVNMIFSLLFEINVIVFMPILSEQERAIITFKNV